MYKIGNEEEIKEMSYDEILELGEAENNMLYYYPSFKVCHFWSQCLHKVHASSLCLKPEPFFNGRYICYF